MKRIAIFSTLIILLVFGALQSQTYISRVGQGWLISGSTIESCTVGATTPSTGSFTTLACSGAFSPSGTITLGAGQDLIGSATSDITINTNKFTVAGATGNTLVAGSLRQAATIGYFIKTVKVTIGHTGDTTADFQWATAANHTAQNLDLGAVVPAFARVLDVTVICTETMVGQTNMLLVLGNQSAGTEFIGSTDCDTINNSIGGAAAGTPFVAINNSASNVWVNGDPDDNTWADMSAGLWTVLVTYVDNSAASSAL